MATAAPVKGDLSGPRPARPRPLHAKVGGEAKSGQDIMNRRAGRDCPKRSSGLPTRA